MKELGKKIAEHWLTLLVLPGLLWVGTAMLASQLRWRDALNPRTASERITHWANQVQCPGVIVLVLASLLLASAAAGLTATSIGALVRQLWMIRGAVTKLYDPASHAFAWYALGMLIGMIIVFVTYLMVNDRQARESYGRAKCQSHRMGRRQHATNTLRHGTDLHPAVPSGQCWVAGAVVRHRARA